MSPDRRYSEDEIAAIFKKASEEQESAKQRLSENQGLSLAELQEIGGDTGLSADQIARAAASLDVVALEQKPRETFLGVPISASHEIELPGKLSNDNWNRLVAEMRETFRAHGKVDENGEFKTWRNGNLRISVEPTDTGHRFRMSTFKGNAKGTILGSLAGAVVALGIITVGTLFTARGISIAGLIYVLGFGGLWFNAFRIPYWSRRRQSQMEALAQRASQMARKSQEESAPQIESHRNDMMELEIPESEHENEEMSLSDRRRSRS